MLLELFLTFFKIGALAFGGGYGIVAFIREDCLAKGWLTEEELLNFIAIAESTPGPIAVNMATFVGSSQGGFLGAALATIGVVLPAFLIIILIATLLTQLIKYAGVKATLEGIRPAVVAMILATSVIMFLSVVMNVTTLNGGASLDWKALIIFAIIAAVYYGYFYLKKKRLSPILLVAISGVMGLILYGV